MVLCVALLRKPIWIQWRQDFVIIKYENILMVQTLCPIPCGNSVVHKDGFIPSTEVIAYSQTDNVFQYILSGKVP